MKVVANVQVNQDYLGMSPDDLNRTVAMAHGYEARVVDEQVTMFAEGEGEIIEHEGQLVLVPPDERPLIVQVWRLYKNGKVTGGMAYDEFGSDGIWSQAPNYLSKEKVGGLLLDLLDSQDVVGVVVQDGEVSGWVGTTNYEHQDVNRLICALWLSSQANMNKEMPEDGE